MRVSCRRSGSLRRARSVWRLMEGTNDARLLSLSKLCVFHLHTFAKTFCVCTITEFRFLLVALWVELYSPEKNTMIYYNKWEGTVRVNLPSEAAGVHKSYVNARYPFVVFTSCPPPLPRTVPAAAHIAPGCHCRGISPPTPVSHVVARHAAVTGYTNSLGTSLRGCHSRLLCPPICSVAAVWMRMRLWLPCEAPSSAWA